MDPGGETTRDHDPKGGGTMVPRGPGTIAGLEPLTEREPVYC